VWDLTWRLGLRCSFPRGAEKLTNALADNERFGRLDGGGHEFELAALVRFHFLGALLWIAFAYRSNDAGIIRARHFNNWIATAITRSVTFQGVPDGAPAITHESARNEDAVRSMAGSTVEKDCTLSLYTAPFPLNCAN
jgi:hypothetical protein